MAYGPCEWVELEAPRQGTAWASALKRNSLLLVPLAGEWLTNLADRTDDLLAVTVVRPILLFLG